MFFSKDAILFMKICRAGDGREDPTSNGISRVIVKWDGTLVLESPGIFNSLCDVDITNFPFDKQHCEFRFTTQNIPDDLVHLQVGKYWIWD